MNLVGGKLIGDLPAKNFRSQLSNASSLNKLNNLNIKTYEVYMMAYLWSWLLICKRFKKIKEADSQVTSSLNVEKLFSALEQPELNKIAIEENRAIILENRKMIEDMRDEL